MANNLCLHYVWTLDPLPDQLNCLVSNLIGQHTVLRATLQDTLAKFSPVQRLGTANNLGLDPFAESQPGWAWPQHQLVFVSYTLRPNDRALVLLLCINIRDIAGAQLIWEIVLRGLLCIACPAYTQLAPACRPCPHETGPIEAHYKNNYSGPCSTITKQNIKVKASKIECYRIIWKCLIAVSWRRLVLFYGSPEGMTKADVN